MSQGMYSNANMTTRTNSSPRLHAVVLRMKPDGVQIGCGSRSTPL